MTEREQEALHLCELGLQQMWKGQVDSAIELYDRATGLAETEETRELITIRKAEALIAADREGPEVSALPGIVLRRLLPRHVYLAANALGRRFNEKEDRRRALFYCEIAKHAAGECGEPLPRALARSTLGISLVADSQFRRGIKEFEEALEIMTPLADREEHRFLRASLLASLGGAEVLAGNYARGVAILEGVLPEFDGDDYQIAEACLDLCFGYIELHHYDLAEKYGARALTIASSKRQIRNANHFLGEICLRSLRYDESDAYFDVVASFYPEFKNVKQLLVAVDLCAVVNWKA